MATEKTKSTYELEIEHLNARVTELQNARTELEIELRPHRDRIYKEKERIENEKRTAERDQKLVETITRLEALVTTHVKDPALRPVAFQHALVTSVGAFGFWR